MDMRKYAAGTAKLQFESFFEILQGSLSTKQKENVEAKLATLLFLAVDRGYTSGYFDGFNNKDYNPRLFCIKDGEEVKED